MSADDATLEVDTTTPTEAGQASAGAHSEGPENAGLEHLEGERDRLLGEVELLEEELERSEQRRKALRAQLNNVGRTFLTKLEAGGSEHAAEVEALDRWLFERAREALRAALGVRQSQMVTSFWDALKNCEPPAFLVEAAAASLRAEDLDPATDDIPTSEDRVGDAEEIACDAEDAASCEAEEIACDAEDAASCEAEDVVASCDPEDAASCEAEDAACETEDAASCETEDAASCETEDVACKAEDAACETVDAASCETEDVACEAEDAATEAIDAASLEVSEDDGDSGVELAEAKPLERLSPAELAATISTSLESGLEPSTEDLEPTRRYGAEGESPLVSEEEATRRHASCLVSDGDPGGTHGRGADGDKALLADQLEATRGFAPGDEVCAAEESRVGHGPAGDNRLMSQEALDATLGEEPAELEDVEAPLAPEGEALGSTSEDEASEAEDHSARDEDVAGGEVRGEVRDAPIADPDRLERLAAALHAEQDESGTVFATASEIAALEAAYPGALGTGTRDLSVEEEVAMAAIFRDLQDGLLPSENAAANIASDDDAGVGELVENWAREILDEALLEDDAYADLDDETHFAWKVEKDLRSQPELEVTTAESVADPECDLFLRHGVLCLTDLLQGLANQESTGVLRLEGLDNLLDLHFTSGQLTFLNPRRIQLDYPEDTFWVSGLPIPPERLESYSEEHRREADSVILQLLAEDVLTPATARRFMMQLGQDAFRLLMADPEQVTVEYFRRDESVRAFLEIDFCLPVQRFLLEVFSRADEWRVFASEVYSPTAVFTTTDLAAEIDLSHLIESHRRVFESIATPRTIATISTVSRLNTFDVCQGLYTLQCMKVAIAED